MEIIVLDNEGKTVRKERRVSRTSIGASSARQPPSKDVRTGDPEPEVSQPRRPKRHAARKQTIITSDDSEPEEEKSPPKSTKISRLNTQIDSRISGLLSQVSKTTVVEVVMPAPYKINQQKIDSLLHSPSIALHSSAGVAVSQEPRIQRQKAITSSTIQSSSSSEVSEQPYLSQQTLPRVMPPTRYPRIPSPIPKTRQLTPIRGRNKRFFDPPSPPSPTTPTDLDLSISFSDFSIESPSQIQGSYRSEFEVPNYLKPILEECHQETCGPHNFSAFIESFPFDPIISLGNRDVDISFRKIGEASYSEVFGIGDVVLKVIPLRDESEAGQSLAPEEDGPAPSDAKDVRKEIIVTRAMGEVYNGFVKLLKTYIVRGRYPEVLLRLWDEYNERKGSESVRPGKINFFWFSPK